MDNANETTLRAIAIGNILDTFKETLGDSESAACNDETMELVDQLIADVSVALEHPQSSRHTKGWDNPRTTGRVMGYLWWDDATAEGDVTLITGEFDAASYVVRMDAIGDWMGMLGRENNAQIEEDEAFGDAKREAREASQKADADKRATTAAALRQAITQDIWYDAAQYGDAPNAENITAAQEAMEAAAEMLEATAEKLEEPETPTDALKTYTVIVREVGGYSDPLIYTVAMENIDDEEKVLLEAARQRCDEIGENDESVIAELANNMRLCFAFESDITVCKDWRT